MTHIRTTTTTDEALRELGDRLQATRLQQNRTAEAIATAAGVSRATVVRAESGHNTSLESLVRILRALGRLDALDAFLPEPLVSPLELARSQGRRRQRARPAPPEGPPE